MPVPLPDGSVLQVWPVLGAVEGDIPWLAKLTNSIGHGGKHACYRCALNGVYLGDAKTVRCGRHSCNVGVGPFGNCPCTGPGFRPGSNRGFSVLSKPSVYRRWLGYAANINQPVPCHADGSIDHRELQADGGVDPGRLILPPGYCTPDDGLAGVREEWTASVATDPSTWCSTSVLKYSQSEILARGQTAEEIRQQVRLSGYWYL